jgi:penicillin-binding protein 2
MPDPIPLKDHEKETRLVNKRLIACALFVVLLSIALVCRLYFLQVIQYDYHSTMSENNRVHVQPIPPSRGLIFDRNGVVIADNRPSFNLSMTRERSGGDWAQVLDTIIEVLELTPDDRIIFEKRMKQGRRPFEPVPILFELTEEQIARIAVNQFRLPGVEVVAQLIRHYPQGAHFAHSVGYMGRINEKELKSLDPVNYSGTHHMGKTGIERFYEPELHGQVGYEEVETNARGRVLRVLKRTDPVPGKDIVLSLDISCRKRPRLHWAGVAGPSWRWIRAPAKYWRWSVKPSFDPNLFVTGISFKAYSELRDSVDRPLFNRILRGLYAPGSTIKPAVAIAGLDTGVVTPVPGCSTPATTCCPITITSTATGTAPVTAGSIWTRRSCVPTTPISTIWRTSWALTGCTTT